MCEHKDFKANVNVNRLEDSGKFMADVMINCVECGAPMAFIGLPLGVNLNGACSSLDGIEGRFAIKPLDKDRL